MEYSAGEWRPEPTSEPPAKERAVGSRGENQLLPGFFPKLCLQKEKKEQGEG